MFIKRVILSLTIIVLINGCGTFKEQWTDFTAYYNTFHNGRKYFEKGFELVEQKQFALHPTDINPILEQPSKVGFKEFESAIEKGAKILRDYDQSKWVDDALLLIGKSYFFQTNYLSALEKFDELYIATQNVKLKKQAVYWKARVYFQTLQMEKALEFISLEIAKEKLNWKANDLALLHLIETEIYVDQKNYVRAYEALERALPHLKKDEYKARSWFVRGQLLELQESYPEALVSYSKVKKFTNNYEHVILAKQKEAEIARLTGNLKKAYNLYVEMRNDDKNFDIISDIKYEIAYTLYLMNKFKESEKLYKETLRTKVNPPKKETTALIHYGIAEINLDFYNDLRTAAAYFDSSSSVAGNAQTLPIWFDAKDLAKNYGDYIRLKDEIRSKDSLLHLATLSPTEIDSVIDVIKERRLAELKKLKKERDRRQSQMINVNASSNQNNQNLDENRNASGFLNHKNKQIVQQNKDAFFAIWGNRPLVDKWRNFSDIKSQMAGNSNTEAISQSNARADGSQLTELKINLDDIPKDSVKKVEYLRTIASNLYEIGNVFYLNLNNPDRGAVYYNRVIDRFPESELSIQSKFVLIDIFTSRNPENPIIEDYASDIIRNDSSQIYAKKVASRFNIPFQESNNELSELEIVVKVLDDTSELNALERSMALREASYQLSNDTLKLKLLDIAVKDLINEAKKSPNFSESFTSYTTRVNQLDSTRNSFLALKDSAKEMMKDSLVKTDTTLLASYKAIVDSTFKEPDLGDYFPFVGELWDSTRTILKMISSKYASIPLAKPSTILYSDLKLPESLIKKPIEVIDSTSTLDSTQVQPSKKVLNNVDSGQLKQDVPY